MAPGKINYDKNLDFENTEICEEKHLSENKVCSADATKPYSINVDRLRISENAYCNLDGTKLNSVDSETRDRKYMSENTNKIIKDKLQNYPNHKIIQKIIDTNVNNKPVMATKDINQLHISNLTSKGSNATTCMKRYKTNEIAKAYQSEEHSKVVSSVTARFFGIFGLAYRTSDVSSNLISYYVLQDENVIDNITENSSFSCGASLCNVETYCLEHNLAEPNQVMRNILTGISVLLTVLAVILLFLFLDELETERKPTKFSFNLAMATCNFIRKKEALLLLPLSAYIGFLQGFYIGDFTKVNTFR